MGYGNIAACLQRGRTAVRPYAGAASIGGGSPVCQDRSPGCAFYLSDRVLGGCADECGWVGQVVLQRWQRAGVAEPAEGCKNGQDIHRVVWVRELVDEGGHDFLIAELSE